MQYWRGVMNWPCDADWRCLICGGRGMTWGLINGQCRCQVCHAEYRMRTDKEILTRPIQQFRDEYKRPAKLGWDRFQLPFDEWDDAKWDEAFAAVEGE